MVDINSQVSRWVSWSAGTNTSSGTRTASATNNSSTQLQNVDNIAKERNGKVSLTLSASQGPSNSSTAADLQGQLPITVARVRGYAVGNGTGNGTKSLGSTKQALGGQAPAMAHDQVEASLLAQAQEQSTSSKIPEASSAAEASKNATDSMPQKEPTPNPQNNLQQLMPLTSLHLQLLWI